ncbi:MAG: DUF3015 family protein [Pseudomonadota bacterium]
MKRKALVGALFSCLLMGMVPAVGSAKEAMVDKMSGQGYGIAGCGLGSILFGAKPGKIQIFAGTTNSFYSNNAFGITSGTSNCDIPQMGQQAAVFIEVNKEVIRKEAAMGQGESLDAVAMLLNCDSVAVSEKMKNNFDHYLGEEVDSFETVRRLMNSNVCSVEG